MTAAVSVSHLVKRYGSVEALSDVTFDIESGELFGLLGPNGAGKTTLISCLSGLARPTSGHLSVLGHDVQKNYRQARRLLGVVPQELVVDPFFNVRETLRLQSGYYGLRRNDDWIDEILEHLGLTSKADQNVRQLSGGMKRRVLVAQALVHKPPVIVLDEPTAGVDVELRQGLWQFVQRLNREGHTIILTTHYLEEAEALCGRLALLKEGRLLTLDSTRNLLARFSGHTLAVRLQNPQQWPEDLRKQTTEEHNGFLHFHLENYAAVESLLDRLRADRLVITDMRLNPPDLEDVFLKMMQP